MLRFFSYAVFAASRWNAATTAMLAKSKIALKRGQMIIGFLHDPKEDLSAIAPEFQAPADKAAVIDLEQFEPICAAMP